MGKRAELKRKRKSFKVGDVVTWGNGRLSHKVVDVCPTGVTVDSTSSGFGDKQEDGRLFMFVRFDHGPQGRGLVRHSSDKPDTLIPWKVLEDRKRELGL